MVCGVEGHLAQCLLLLSSLKGGDRRGGPKYLSVGKPGPAYYLAPLRYLRHSADGFWEHQEAGGTEVETMTRSGDRSRGAVIGHFHYPDLQRTLCRKQEGPVLTGGLKARALEQ